MKVSMSAVWDRTSEFLSDHGRAVFALAALALFLPSAIVEALGPLATGGVGPQIILGLLSLAAAIVSLWGQAAITALAIDPVGGQGAARNRATARLPALILVMILVLLIGPIVGVPILVILADSGVDFFRLNQPGALQSLTPGATGFIGLYVLFVAVPLLIFLLARLAVLAMPVVIAEGLSVGAIARAFRLTRGLTVKIIALGLLYAVVLMVASLAAKTVFGLLFGYLLGGEGPITTASVLTAIVTTIVSTAFTVLLVSFSAKLYLAARTLSPPAGASAIDGTPVDEAMPGA